MGVRIFHTMPEYVEHIEEGERNPVATLYALSFLPSHLFSKSIVLRYYEKDSTNRQNAKLAANTLWQRGKNIHANMRIATHKEIWEIGAFEELCKNGIVHRQAPDFRATPKEIVEVLQKTALLLRNLPLYEIALCREVLPFVFIVKVGAEVTIDVRNNFGYQQIQGLAIDDAQIAAEFEREFSRIWNEETTLSDREQIISVIEKNIALVSNGSRFLVR